MNGLPPPPQDAVGAVSSMLGPVLAAAPFADTTDITALLAPIEASDASAAAVSATSVAAPVVRAGEPTTGTSLLAPQARGPRSFGIPLAPIARFSTSPTSAVDAAWRESPAGDWAGGGPRHGHPRHRRGLGRRRRRPRRS